MITKCYFIDETQEAYHDTLESVINLFPCFIAEEPIEFNFVAVTIKMRTEDAAGIERLLAKIV